MNIRLKKGFFESRSQLWQNHEFEDFKVIVDGDIYTCHSVVLAECSEFFAGLLRSNMKEKQEMEVHLKNISSPVFQLILNSLYTGCELLTKENVLEVWSAVHQLQIHFLIEHCEDFVRNNLSFDTVEMYETHAEYLQSERVCEHIFNFMLKNYKSLRKHEIFLRLEFQYLLKLLKSDKLKVSSEDDVVSSIFQWVEYGNIMSDRSQTIKTVAVNEPNVVLPNTAHDTNQNMEESNIENSHFKLNVDSIKGKKKQNESNVRKKFFIELLKAARYYLLSDACVERLYKNKLIQGNASILKILLEAVISKRSDYWQYYWPAPAIHRDCSNLEHVCVYSDEGQIEAFSFKKQRLFSIQNLPNKLDVKLTILKGKLYACTIGSNANEIYVYKGKKWVQKEEVHHDVHLLLTHKKAIYVFNTSEKLITRFILEKYHSEQVRLKNKIENLQYAISFHNNIVVFSSVDDNGVEETAVHSWNTDTNVWRKVSNLPFSSQNMTCFCDDRDTYILDSYGDLWKLKNSKTISFTFVAKLWNKKVNIKGAVLFRETLFMFDDSPDQLDLLSKVEGLYSSTRMWELKATASNLIHYILPTRALKAF